MMNSKVLSLWAKVKESGSVKTMKEKIDFTDINVRAQIAFGLALIAGLLAYIAYLR